MNLLMIIIIVLAIWVGVAICYFAWQLVPKVTAPPPDVTVPDDDGPDSNVP